MNIPQIIQLTTLYVRYEITPNPDNVDSVENKIGINKNKVENKNIFK